jgi:hypothetical protein
MELKRNTRPLGRPSIQPEVEQERTVTFSAASAPEPLQRAEREELVVPPLQPVSRASTASGEAGSGIPRLVPVTRQRQKIELVAPGAIAIPELSPQPTAAVEAVAEPVQETGGGREVAWPFGDEHADEPTREEISNAIPSLEVNEGRGGNFNARPALWAADDSGTPRDVGEDSVEPDVEVDSVPAIPALQRVIVEEGEIRPSLTVLRDGGALPVSLTEIPQLDSFNNMEQAYLLLGRSSENEEIVILQSYGERFLRGKSKEDKAALIAGRVTLHEDKLVADNYYDHADRRDHRRIQTVSITPQLAAKGVEMAFALRDNGRPAAEDVNRYAVENEVEVDQAVSDCQGPTYNAYTWALIKIKIGRDFGSFSLTDLMPEF